MLKVIMQKKSIFAVTVALTLLALTGSTALALVGNTWVCDSSSKYYCMWVNYSQNGSGWIINHRYYLGATDGGASQWQLFYAKDWYWNGTQWVFLNDWGSSAWYYNYYWDIWREKGPAVSVPYYSTVTMRTRYYEPVSRTYWCSLVTQHDLWTGVGWEWGTGACNPA